MTWQGGFSNPTVGSAQIQDGSITTAKLADGAVVEAKLADLAVAAGKLQDEAVQNAKLGTDSVSTAKVQDLSIVTGKIGLLAVGSAQIADLAVTNAKIGLLAVDSAQIADLAVTNAKIASLSADKITAGTITADLTVTSDIEIAVGGGINIAGAGGLGNTALAMDSSTDVDLVWSASGGEKGRISVNSDSLMTLTAGATANGQIYLNADWVELNDGDTTHPGLTFTNDDDTGLYRYTTNGIGFVTGGTRSVSIAANGDVGLHANQRLYGSTNSATTSNTSPRFLFDAGNGWGWFATSAQWTMILQRNSDGEALRFYRSSTLTGSIGTVAGTLTLYVGSSTRTISILDGGSSSSVYIRDGLTDVGNHETLRLNRGTGSTVAAIGYYSSALADKKQVTPIAKSKLWQRKWFMDLEPITYRRRTKPHGREYGFYLENLGEHTNQLTTKGDKAGGSPDEFALLAVTVDYVQHLEQRVKELEKAA